MLSKKFRFHSRGGVRYVYQYGKTLRSSKMSLVFMPNERGFMRVAVVVSKKIEKTAVKRNLIRRRIYEILRNNFNTVPKKTDYIFVIYSKDVLKMKEKDLKDLVLELVEESKVCYNESNG